MPSFTSLPKKQLQKYLRYGDLLVLGLCILLVIGLTHAFWQTAPAARVVVRVDGRIQGTYSINQARILIIQGSMGKARIEIAQGRVRFLASPCHNQYCVHQGWLQRAGAVAVCLPNHVQLELQGDVRPYDGMVY